MVQIKATDADDSTTLNGMVDFKLVDGTGKGAVIEYKKKFITIIIIVFV